MASTKVIAFISGKLNWAKVLGAPVTNYNKDGREWTFELEPNEAGIQTILKNGLEDRIKGKGYFKGQKGQYAEREPFIILKRTEFDKEGEANKPIRVYDADDKAWDPMLDDKGNVTNLIGNGSAADVKVDIRDYGVGKKKGFYPAAIRVTDHVEYEGGGEFGGMAEDDAPAPAKGKGKKDAVNKDFGLDDEIPF